MTVAAGTAKPRRAPGRTTRRRPPRPARLPFDVVEAKIQIPGPREGSVSRTALVNRLKTVEPRSVVAIAAPAGYGKTTLLGQWAARDSRPVAWVSVDERDNDPIVLLQHVAAALHRIDPLDASVLDALRAPPRPSIWASIVPRLGTALRSLDNVVLVLDDAHLLRSRRSLEAVTALTDHIGDASVLVVAGRVTPRLPIAVLRAAGRLFELDAEQLALSPREAQLLCRSAGVELTFGEVIELVRRCEGWPAALYLAALARRDGETRTTRGEHPVEFGGADRNLADYVRSEYLSKLRPGARRFLRLTSVVEPMCGALCDAVLKDVGSARELERIERANLFLVPLDRQRVWYRYHHLFRDLLQRELEEHEPELVPELHRRAADWYESRADLEPALEHADAAGDAERAARLITAIALPLYNSGHVATVEQWLARFDSPALLKRYPAVAVQGSWVHALRGRSAEAAQWLRIAETARFKGRLADGSSLLPWTAALRAAMCHEGAEQMIADAESSLSRVPRDSQIRASALTFLGVGHMLLGRDDRADATFATAASEAERLAASEMQVIAIAERSLIAFARDDPVAAETFALEADDVVERSHLGGYMSTALALAASARASLRHGRWDDARTQLTKVHDLEPILDSAPLAWFTLQTRLEVVRAYVALRDVRSARSVLAEIHGQLRGRPDVGVLADDARSLTKEVDAMPALGDGAAAGLTAAELRLLPFLATHLSFREIGEQLYVSRNTIKTQAISVYRKLGVSSRSDAIDRAASLGLVEGTHTI